MVVFLILRLVLTTQSLRSLNNETVTADMCVEPAAFTE